MTIAFSDIFLEELAVRNDIVDVVGSYVSLTKKSGGNQFGLCPFHSEKTPSFSVSADKQMYYCFGCHKGGGVINFVMEIESLPFPDAVHFLARRAGIAVPDEGGYDEAMKRRERLLGANREAARFFRKLLSEPLGREAIDYINRRGISTAMVRQFGLGAAPEGWNTLTDHMTRLGYTQDELVAAGLARRGKTGGIYDAFRGRLVFPVIDVRSNVLAFSGRILGDGEPKYLNTSDTPVFNKSRNLYGIHLARKSRAEYFLLVEGNIDVVSLHQAGFDSAVAPLGTALTADQARLMHQYKQEAIIAFDADSAGQRAADRAIGILEKTGIRVRVLRIPDGKDPDDFIKNHGPDAFHALIQQRETHIEFRLLSLRQKFDLDRDPERVAYSQEAIALLAGLESEVELEVYGRRVAEQTGVSLESIKAGVKRQREKNRNRAKRRMEKDGSRPAQSAQPKERSLRYQNAYSAVAEEGVIRLILTDPALFQEPPPLTTEDFSSSFLGRAYGVLLERTLAGKENTAATLAPLFPPEEMGRLMHLLNQPESLPDSRQSLADYIKKIQTEKLKQSPEDNLQQIYAKYKEQKGVDKDE
ncbi:MAG: DNA primase [Oscillospiraceae bacterium]|nr:DNA primase [Oscillospiraceae bacterium]